MEMGDDGAGGGVLGRDMRMVPMISYPHSLRKRQFTRAEQDENRERQARSQIEYNRRKGYK